MLVSCGKCGRIHERGDCPVKRIYNRTDTDKLRNKNRWRQKALQIRQDAFGLCEVCKKEGQYNYKGLEVHHIVKLRDDPDGLLEDYNLICLCNYHHRKADAGEIQADYLKQLAKERIEGAGEQPQSHINIQDI